MKLVYLTPFQFFGAIIIGILLSLTVGGILMSPDPVSEPVQVITPVPTPREVYVQPTYQPPVQNTQEPAPLGTAGIADDPLYSIIAILPLAIVGVAIMTMVVSIFGVYR